MVALLFKYENEVNMAIHECACARRMLREMRVSCTSGVKLFPIKEAQPSNRHAQVCTRERKPAYCTLDVCLAGSSLRSRGTQ